MVFIILALIIASWFIPIYFGFILRKYYKFIGFLTFISMTLTALACSLCLIYSNMIVNTDDISYLIDVVFLSAYGSIFAICMTFLLNMIFMLTNFKNRPKTPKENVNISEDTTIKDTTILEEIKEEITDEIQTGDKKDTN